MWVQQKEEALLKVAGTQIFWNGTQKVKKIIGYRDPGPYKGTLLDAICTKTFLLKGTNIAYEEPPATAALTLDDVQVQINV